MGDFGYVCAMKQYASKPQWRSEGELERRFQESGPFFHLHTEPLTSDMIFKQEVEYLIALLYVAVAAWAAGVQVVAYALMSNHFHFILQGTEAQCLEFWGRFERRLSLYFIRHGRSNVLKSIPTPKPTPITTLKQFRDEVVYVIRNPFVVQKGINPLAYEWCSGFLYFNPTLSWMRPRPASSLSCREKAKLLKSNDLRMPESLSFVDGHVFPPSFVNYRLVESLFDNARAFVLHVFKNVESQVETALRFGEKPFLGDDELFPVVMGLCRKEFGTQGTYDLTEEQRYALARRLKDDYYASNGQIARLTHLPPSKVDALYPLSAKNQYE